MESPQQDAKEPRLYSGELIARLLKLIEERKAEENLPHKKGRPRHLQFSFAKLSRDADIPIPTLNDYRRGRRTLSFAAMDRLMWALGISVLDLIHSTEVIHIYDNVLTKQERNWAKHHSRFLRGVDEPIRRKPKAASVGQESSAIPLDSPPNQA